MKKLATPALLFSAACAFLAGCTTPAHPRRIETGGLESVTTMGLDMADLMDAAQRFTRELLVHDAIGNFQAMNGRLARIDVGAIINNTRERIRIEQVSNRISEELLGSGQVTVVAHDAAARQANTLDNFLGDAKVSFQDQADYYLEGSIMQQIAQQGGLREVTYTFQLRLNDRGRNSVFMRTYDITKQGAGSNRRGGVSLY